MPTAIKCGPHPRSCLQCLPSTRHLSSVLWWQCEAGDEERCEERESPFQWRLWNLLQWSWTLEQPTSKPTKILMPQSKRHRKLITACLALPQTSKNKHKRETNAHDQTLSAERRQKENRQIIQPQRWLFLIHLRAPFTKFAIQWKDFPFACLFCYLLMIHCNTRRF